ncbi:MAG: hypothetical protein A3K18_21160 [Lentisphaerae bacterium RIFOXYA12_64_32]|nr:MAG: hypothetical protein A3K18_21160 [Lentisphaerae bacterium RIFOXYA12_64_32]
MKNTGLWRIGAAGVAVAVWSAVGGVSALAADEKKDAAAEVKPAAVLAIDVPGIGTPVDPNRVIVDVDGVKLTQREMDEQLKQMLSSPRMAGIPPEQLAQIRPRMEDTVKKNFIGRVVLVKEADRLKIEVTPEEIDKAIEQLQGRIPPGANFEDLLKQSGLTVDSLKKEMTRDMRIGKLLEQETAEKAKVSDEEIEKFYNDSREQFRQPEQAHARHILFKTEPDADDKTKQEKKAAAEAARKQLTEGADFAALAKEKSDCPSGKQGGDLGNFERGNMVKEFEDAAFSQKLNDIGPIVETKFGYHIIQVLERTEAKDKTLAESRDEIVGYMKQRKQRAAVDGYLEELQAKAKITDADDAKPADAPDAKPAAAEPAK